MLLGVPEHQRNELTQLLQDATSAFPQEVARIYQSVVIPAAMEKQGLERFNLGTRSSVKGSTLWDDAFAFLAAKWHYLDSLAPSLVASDHFGIWPPEADYVSTQRLWESFVQFPHLPILASKQVLLDAIRKGCDDGVLGYAAGDMNGPLSADQGRFGPHNATLRIEIAPTTWVLHADYARTHILPGHDPVRELPPELLMDPAIWPTGSGRCKLTDIWAAIVDHYAPRPVDGPHVLNAALHSAAANNMLRVAVDGGAPTPTAEQLGPERVTQLRIMPFFEIVFFSLVSLLRTTEITPAEAVHSLCPSPGCNSTMVWLVDNWKPALLHPSQVSVCDHTTMMDL